MTRIQAISASRFKRHFAYLLAVIVSPSHMPWYVKNFELVQMQARPLRPKLYHNLLNVEFGHWVEWPQKCSLKKFASNIPRNTLTNGQIGWWGFVFEFFLRFSQNSCYTLECLTYDINSTCVGKAWPWRIQWWVKLHFPTLWGRHGGFWSRWTAQNLQLRSIARF